MTAEQFIADMQTNYRSKYNPVQGKYILTWLAKNQNRINSVFAETLKTFDPTSTKPIPGIFDFEKALTVVKVHRERPELQAPETLLIDEDMVTGEKASAMLIKALGPLCEKMNIRRKK